MSEPIWAKIEFPVALIDSEIQKALEGYGVDFQDDGIPLSKESGWDMENGVEDGIFWLSDSQARYGQFDFEGLLKDCGVPFDRETGMDFNSEPGMQVYRPARNGEPEVDKWITEIDGKAVVSVTAIREQLARTDTEKGPAENVRDYLDFNFPSYPPLSDWVGPGLEPETIDGERAERGRLAVQAVYGKRLAD